MRMFARLPPLIALLGNVFHEQNKPARRRATAVPRRRSPPRDTTAAEVAVAE
jgi:hypothetical protein